jgi:hypothetical protein
MNISYVTLFPGLDGFARSLYHHIEMFVEHSDEFWLGEEFGSLFQVHTDLYRRGGPRA